MNEQECPRNFNDPGHQSRLTKKYSFYDSDSFGGWLYIFCLYLCLYLC